MGRESLLQDAFNAGELSPLLLSRTSVQKRGNGLYTCLNWIPLVQGGLTRRPGTSMLKEVKFSDKATRLFPFQYSVTQTYQLEFGAGYIRFFAVHGLLTQAAQDITAVTKAATAVLTYGGADTYANDDRVYITDVAGMTQLNNREFIVKNVNTGANTFELYERIGGADVAVNSTGYDTFTSGVGSLAEIFQVTTTFAEADLADIRVVQSADVLYILHPDFPPQQLVRVSALSWTLSDLVLTDGPYDVANTTATTLTPSAATGAGVTLTASAVTGINNNTGFQTTDVGRLIRILEGSTWGYVEITGYTSTTVVTVTVLSTLTNTNPKATWRMGVWSDTTGYPTCGVFHEDRLWLGGAAVYPQRVDGSRTGLYGNFSPSATNGTVTNDNAVAFVMNSNNVNNLRWLASTDKGLAVGTERGEWLLRPSALGEAITPTNIGGKPTTNHGSENIEPVQASKATLFVQRAGRKLRELVYVFEVDGFKAPDMTVLAEHITDPSITRLAYLEQPQALLFAPRSDGVLVGFTYERDQDVVGWHRHELGGQSDSGGLLIPVVEDCIATPDPDGVADELYALVRRYVNGASRRYVEIMTPMWTYGDDQEDAVHLDCSWTTVNSPATDTVTGLWHLEGESVVVYVDGAVHPAVTVTNGKITLGYSGSVITLGYAYNSDAVTMPPEGGAQEGTSQGKTKRIIRLGLWLLDTLGIKFGRDESHLTEVVFRQWGDLFGQPPALFTGVLKRRFEGDYDRLAQVFVRCDGPFPATLLALMPQLETADDS
jgi:hypothetical protein